MKNSDHLSASCATGAAVRSTPAATFVLGLVTAIFMLVPAAYAFDAAGADILGLRLGMPETDVVTTLRQEGYAMGHDHGALTAKTGDGRLTVELSAQSVQQIRYAFTARGSAEPQKIMDSIIDRFGPPTQQNPPGWCHALDHEEKCSGDAAAMIFEPKTLTLILHAAPLNSSTQ